MPLDPPVQNETQVPDYRIIADALRRQPISGVQVLDRLGGLRCYSGRAADLIQKPGELVALGFWPSCPSPSDS